MVARESAALQWPWQLVDINSGYDELTLLLMQGPPSASPISCRIAAPQPMQVARRAICAKQACLISMPCWLKMEQPFIIQTQLVNALNPTEPENTVQKLDN